MSWLSKRTFPLVGISKDPIKFTFESTSEGKSWKYESNRKTEGLINVIRRRHSQTKSENARKYYEKYMTNLTCTSCNGAKLQAKILGVLIGEKNIHEIYQMSINDALEYFNNLEFTTREKIISLKQEKPLEKELNVVKEGGKLRTERDDAKKEFKLKLHESLLPVKSEKDKKLIKEYFSKIFALLSKDLRQQIIDLKISKKEKRELLEELAFLSEADQVKYIESLVDLYRKLPKKLIEKIRKLPNVKPKHYDKIVEQLKYMDSEEQINFVQFLEENA